MATALNDLCYLFAEEDQPGLEEYITEYFTSHSVSFQDKEESQSTEESDNDNTTTGSQ